MLSLAMPESIDIRLLLCVGVESITVGLGNTEDNKNRMKSANKEGTSRKNKLEGVRCS
jgi:hypothetical protein